MATPGTGAPQVRYPVNIIYVTKLQQTFQSTKKKRENFHFSRFFIKNSLLTSQCLAMGLRTSLTAFGKRKKIN